MAFSEDDFSIDPLSATLASCITMVEIQSQAHKYPPNPIVPLLWPAHLARPKPEPSSGPEVPPTQAQLEEEHARTLNFLRQPENHYHLVTEKATGEGVAFVWWQKCKGKTEDEWAQAYEKRYRSPRLNEPLFDATNGVRLLRRAKILGDKDLYMLKELYVRPEFQRKGIGSRLVKMGVEKADESDLPSYVEATPEGLGLYLKYGFEEVDRVSVDLGDWGGEKGVLNSFGLLYRPAQSART